MDNITNGIGFIGAGNMGEALISGIAASGIIEPSMICAFDSNVDKVNTLVEKWQIKSLSFEEIASTCHFIIIAVKPDGAKSVLSLIKDYLQKSQVIVSIVAGLSTADIISIIGEDKRVVRVMPNTPAKVGEGMSAICGGGKATDEDIEAVRRVFACVGRATVIAEDKMDAVTGLSGSSPAFIFQVIEAMSDAGVMAGLKRADAMEMAAQAVLGAAKMVLETGLHPAVLKDMVTSPGGTTIEGVYCIEKGGVRAAFIEAISAAVAKSKMLNKK